MKVNDIHMYYEIQGEGEPLVLILGLGTDISEWSGIIRWFAEKYQVLAFDNRGVGRTDKPDKAYSIEMMVDDTAGLMQKLGIQQAYIIGISLGGRIALGLSLRQAECVKKLVLVSTSARVVKNWRRRFYGLLSGSAILPSLMPSLNRHSRTNAFGVL
jgi:pimeloyl-ACP methyl ester carboxylesterase